MRLVSSINQSIIYCLIFVSSAGSLRLLPRALRGCQRITGPNPLSAVTSSALESSRSSSFDLKLAVILAGYSFEAYNEPSVGKVACGLDGTHITFTSSEYIRRLFTGALVVNLRRGEVKVQETELAERLVSGAYPDPYVVISVLEAPSTPRTRSRILDSAQSTHRSNTKKPHWDESFYMYVADPNSATLTFRVLDREVFTEDQLIGVGAIAVAELQEQSKLLEDDSDSDRKSKDEHVGVPVPLYLEDADAGNPLLNFPFPRKKVRLCY
jgi:C2 domain